MFGLPEGPYGRSSRISPQVSQGSGGDPNTTLTSAPETSATMPIIIRSRSG